MIRDVVWGQQPSGPTGEAQAKDVEVAFVDERNLSRQATAQLIAYRINRRTAGFTAACPSQAGVLPGGSCVSLRIASRAVEASLQSPLPPCASQNHVHELTFTQSLHLLAYHLKPGRAESSR